MKINRIKQKSKHINATPVRKLKKKKQEDKNTEENTRREGKKKLSPKEI